MYISTYINTHKHIIHVNYCIIYMFTYTLCVYVDVYGYIHIHTYTPYMFIYVHVYIYMICIYQRGRWTRIGPAVYTQGRAGYHKLKRRPWGWSCQCRAEGYPSLISVIRLFNQQHVLGLSHAPGAGLSAMSIVAAERESCTRRVA